MLRRFVICLVCSLCITTKINRSVWESLRMVIIPCEKALLFDAANVCILDSSHIWLLFSSNWTK